MAGQFPAVATSSGAGGGSAMDVFEPGDRRHLHQQQASRLASARACSNSADRSSGPAAADCPSTCSRVLEVRGRTSGQPRRTQPVQPTRPRRPALPGRAARGHPVGRNLRASGEGRLLSRAAARASPPSRSPTTEKAADPARLPEALEGRGGGVLRRRRPRLARSRSCVAAAPKHPVFRLSGRPGSGPARMTRTSAPRSPPRLMSERASRSG